MCSNHDMCDSKKRNELSIAGLKLAIEQLQQKAWDLLITHHFVGVSVGDLFWDDCAKLHDQLGNRSTGYWFGMHPANRLIILIWTGAFLTHAELPKTVGGTNVDQRSDMQYIKHSWDLCMVLSLLMQITCGGPACLTEMQSVMFRNTLSAMQNVYIDNKMVFYVFSYDK